MLALAFAMTLLPPDPSGSCDGFDELKTSLCEAGDLDGDGIPDIVVGSRDDTLPEMVWALSGRDGRLLWQLSGSSDLRGLGACLANVGDLDEDGVNEIWIGAPGSRRVRWRTYNSANPGKAFLVSGASGTILLELAGEPGHPSFGRSVACAGDVDGDGSIDLAVSVSGRESPSRFVRVFSGRDGTPLLEISPRPDASCVPSPDFGSSMCAVDDYDGDGRGDLAVTDPGAQRVLRGGAEGAKSDPIVERVGCVTVFSGRTGSIACRIFGEREADALGWAITPIVDLDEDGHADLLASGLDRCARVLSGADLSDLCPTIDLRSHRQFSRGQSLAWIDDEDGDGRPEVVIGANDAIGGEFFDSGFASLHSSRDGSAIRVLYHSEWNGVDVCSPGDLDGDGKRDVALSLVGPKRWGDAGHQIRALSSRTGKVIFDVYSGDLRRSLATTDRNWVTPR